ncbi:putative diphthamide synthesis protein-domain-containing protein [Lipomyces japonicus]|uniref:putative diphthamide synthesis protein-domain-containing protein n=1 Tax=Lipomyces japonicus TaxID=56871 RepID=UPI0034CE7657
MSTTEPTPGQRRFGGRRRVRVDFGEGDSSAVVDGAGEVVRRTARVPKIPLINQIPAEILQDQDLNEAIKLLPGNYDFEIHKCVWNIKRHGFKKIALQLPEGLLIFACLISDILERFCTVDVLIMGDVTYGACCIDDYTAKTLGCDLLIHYAHSCLIPVDVTEIKVLYVFVSIGINDQHLAATIKQNFNQGSHVTLVGTIQFNGALHAARRLIESANDGNGITVDVPQIAPLSRGEVLGCTAPRLDPKLFSSANGGGGIVYVGDGRFHLEAAMIQNPGVPAYRYDPYSRKFTREEYEHAEMLKVRRDAIDTARHARRVAIVLGTLGRQGNYNTLSKIKSYLQAAGIEQTLILLSEIFPQKLAEFEHVDAFVQVACPRLSIDWGYAFAKPLLTPYEACIAFGGLQIWHELDDVVQGKGEGYRMDYYGKHGLGRTTDQSITA